MCRASSARLLGAFGGSWRRRVPAVFRRDWIQKRPAAVMLRAFVVPLAGWMTAARLVDRVGPGAGIGGGA